MSKIKVAISGFGRTPTVEQAHYGARSIININLVIN